MFVIDDLRRIVFSIREGADPGSGEYASFSNKAGDVFWGNIGAGVLPISKKTGRILLNYRSKYVNEPNEYGVWGGKVDNEDIMDIEAEVEREFREESRYRGKIKLIPAYVFHAPSGNFRYYNFIGLVEEEFEPSLDWESEGFLWVTIDELIDIDPMHFGLESLLRDRKSMNVIKRYSK